ncbi:NAD(P)H-dependent oxidoreductase [Candidatus Binatia bacterium]|jgi:glutathione-regulated potassium-efflux system ancillary protein KefG|nr:NAD(P)H-dependent oxidoreductase [Candidatus Binatia bacterium]
MTDLPRRRRILILFAHPALHRSRVNRALVQAVRDLEGVTLHDLYELYPDFDVDAEHEQDQLLRHDLLILQHPFYWYSTPALVKQWLDVVLQLGWAYGRSGTALRGKQMLSVITAGGSERAYARDGVNGYSIAELLAPLAQTARLCGMDYLPPYVLHGTHGLGEEEIARHAEEYRSVLEALRDGRVDLDAARRRPYLNHSLDAVVRS